MIGFSSHCFDLQRLQKTVEGRLCDLGMLESGQFPLTVREIVKAGQICGLYYCLHGPRSVKLTAICDLNTKSLILYGVDGVRRENVELTIVPKNVSYDCRDGSK